MIDPNVAVNVRMEILRMNPSANVSVLQAYFDWVTEPAKTPSIIQAKDVSIVQS